MPSTPSSFLDLSQPFRVLGAYLRGIRSVVTSPKLLLLFLAQLAIGIFSYLILAYFAFSHRSDVTAMLTGTVDSWWEYLLAWIVFLVMLVLTGFAAYLLTVMLGSFVLEWFAQTLLKQLGAPVDEELSIDAITRTVKRTAIFAALRGVAGLIVLTLSLVALFFPPLGAITMVLLAFLVGIDMMELPTSLLQPAARTKINLLSAHKPEILWFGVIATALLAIPFVGVLFLPAICAAATHTVVDIYSR